MAKLPGEADSRLLNRSPNHSPIPSDRGLFLDRDGTLNFDPNYLNDPEKLHLLPGVVEALRLFRDAGYRFFVVSNQSGVARGKITPDQLRAVNEKLDSLLAAEGLTIEAYGLCIHHPDEDCACRKPKPKLVHDLARAHGIDVSRSIMVGDKVSDVELGVNAGCAESVFVLSGFDSRERREIAERVTPLVYDDLYAYARAKFGVLRR